MSNGRIKTGILGLDEMLGGGFLPNSANLIEGAPGTGKTTVALQFIYNGIVDYNENGLIISFEEFPTQYYHDAANFGWDLKKLERRSGERSPTIGHVAERRLKILFSSPSIILEEIREPGSELIRTIEELNIKRVVIDSVTHFESIAKNSAEARDVERQLVNGFKREGVTTVFIRENDSILGQSATVVRSSDSAIAAGSSKMPFIVDSYMLLRYVEIDSEIQKALIVLKMRGSDHQKDIRRYRCTQNGIEVESKFTGREGIMSGNPRARPQDAFVDVFKKARKA